MKRELHEENRRAWNAATQAHNSHKGDQARYLREGGNTLFPDELELLGELRGKRLLHLQCNSGQDTLSLAKLGAVVTGVDISDEAVGFAQRLSRDSGIPGTFVRADVFDYLEQTGAGTERFELCFSSYGTLMWLSNLKAWARGIASVLEPGGRMVVLDFHPFALIFDSKWVRDRPYFTDGKAFTEASGIGDYVERAKESLVPWGYEEGVRDFKNPHPSHEFGWGVGDLLTAVLEAGLVLEVFREYPYINGDPMYETMKDLPGRRKTTPEGMPNLPLMFGLVARRPERSR
jgi:SAM-dependent methyltransferase